MGLNRKSNAINNTADCLSLLSLAASYGIHAWSQAHIRALSLLDLFRSQTINIFHLFAYLKCVSDIFALRQCTSLSLLLLSLRPYVCCVSNSVLFRFIFISSHICFVCFIIADTVCSNPRIGPRFRYLQIEYTGISAPYRHSVFYFLLILLRFVFYVRFFGFSLFYARTHIS